MKKAGCTWIMISFIKTIIYNPNASSVFYFNNINNLVGCD